MDNLEYTYTGPVYIRPMSRGVILLPDDWAEGQCLLDVLDRIFGVGDHNMEITIKVLPEEDNSCS